MRSGRRQALLRQGWSGRELRRWRTRRGHFPLEEVSNQRGRDRSREARAPRGIAGCVISIARTRRKPAPYSSKALIILPMPSKNHSHALSIRPYPSFRSL